MSGTMWVNVDNLRFGKTPKCFVGCTLPIRFPLVSQTCNFVVDTCHRVLNKYPKNAAGAAGAAGAGSD